MAELRTVVLDRPDLQARLLSFTEPSDFVAAVADLAAELRLPLSALDIEAEVREAHRSWVLRWV
jgi:hypothetical protein